MSIFLRFLQHYCTQCLRLPLTSMLSSSSQLRLLLSRISFFSTSVLLFQILHVFNLFIYNFLSDQNCSFLMRPTEIFLVSKKSNFLQKITTHLRKLLIYLLFKPAIYHNLYITVLTSVIQIFNRIKYVKYNNTTPKQPYIFSLVYIFPV